jgi:hypothetical protein
MQREEGRWKKRENGWEKREFIYVRMDAFKKNYSSPILRILSNDAIYIKLSNILLNW